MTIITFDTAQWYMSRCLDLRKVVHTQRDKEVEQLQLELSSLYSEFCFRARYFWGRVPNFNQSDARKQRFLDFDWLEFMEPFPKNTSLYHQLQFKRINQ